MTIETRVEQLKREIAARYGKGEFVFVAVVCNRCGTVVEAESVPKLLPLIEGWRLGRYGEDADYCPECRVSDHYIERALG